MNACVKEGVGWWSSCRNAKGRMILVQKTEWFRLSEILPAESQNEQTVYNIMYDINVCSCMISYPTQVLWYHDMNAMISYTKSYNIKCAWNKYDIIAKGMISYMITGMTSIFCLIWYWFWYHACSFDIMYNIIYTILCMILQYYDITWQNSWYCKWYHIQNQMILCDNVCAWKFLWYHKKMYDIIYDIEYDIDFSYRMIFINLKIISMILSY